METQTQNYSEMTGLPPTEIRIGLHNASQLGFEPQTISINA